MLSSLLHYRLILSLTLGAPKERKEGDLQSLLPNIYTPNSPVAHCLIKGAI